MSAILSSQATHSYNKSASMNTASTSDGLPNDGLPTNGLPTNSASTRRAASGRPSRRRGLLSLLPLKIADAYLLRHMIEATTRGLVWFVSLLMMVSIIGAVRKLVDNTLDFEGLVRVLLSELPRLLLFTIPMAILFGTVQTFSDLSSKGEATALQVGGMSLGRMMRGPLIWGAILGLCVFVLQEKIVPSTQQNKQQVLAQAIAESGVRQNFDISLPRDNGGNEMKINARLFDPSNGRMTDPDLKIYNQDGGYRRIRAKSGVWNLKSGKWKLFKVRSESVSGEGLGAQFNAANFGEIEFDLPSPQALSSNAKSLRQNLDKGNFEMASIADLSNRRAELQRENAKAQTAPQRVTANILINKMTYGIHDKLATPWVCVFLVLVGAPLALRPQRASGGFSMGLSLVVLLAYYVLWSTAQGIGRGGLVNPIFMGYLPAASTLLIGLVLFWKKSR